MQYHQPDDDNPLDRDERDRRDFVRSQRAMGPADPGRSAQPQSTQPDPQPFSPAPEDGDGRRFPPPKPGTAVPMTGPFPATPHVTAPSARPRTSGVQILLLVLGVGLITIAVLAFASSMVTMFGDAARAALIGVVGAAGLVVSRLIARRLHVTAEGVAWAGFAALGIDAALIGDLAPVRDSAYRYQIVGGTLLLAATLALALGLIPFGRPARPLRAPGLYATIVAPWAAAMILDLPMLPRAVTDSCSAVCLAAMAAAACLIPDRVNADADALSAKPRAAERVILLSGSMLLLAALALGDFDSSLPGLPSVAIGAYALMLLLAAVVWTVPVPLTGAAGSALRWIVGVAAGLVAIALTVLAAVDRDRIVPADLVTALFGLMALAIGANRMRIEPALRSWTALWPGLAFLFAPALIAAWIVPDPTSPRSLLLLAASIGALLAGAFLGWRAPLTTGATVLTLHMLRQLWPWLVLISRDCWWVWPLIAGLVLVVAAARYEASLASVRSIGRRIAQLR